MHKRNNNDDNNIIIIMLKVVLYRCISNNNDNNIIIIMSKVLLCGCICSIACAESIHSNSTFREALNTGGEQKSICNGSACHKLNGFDERSLWQVQHGGCYESSVTSDEYFHIISPLDCSTQSAQSSILIQWETSHTTADSISVRLEDHHHYWLDWMSVDPADNSVTLDTSLEWGNAYFLYVYFRTGWYYYREYISFSVNECDITNHDCVSVSVSSGDSNQNDECLYFSTGDTMIIEWIAPPDAVSVNIYLSLKYGIDYETDELVETLTYLDHETCPIDEEYCIDSYEWIVGGTEIGSSTIYRIKIIAGIEDIGYSQTFTIDNRAGLVPQINVMSPHESEIYVEGDIMSIQWSVSGTTSWYSDLIFVDCGSFEPFGTTMTDTLMISSDFPNPPSDGYSYYEWKVLSPTTKKIDECYIWVRFWSGGVEIIGMSDTFYLQANETCLPTQTPTLLPTNSIGEDSLDVTVTSEEISLSTTNIGEDSEDTASTSEGNLIKNMTSDDDDQLMSKASLLSTRAYIQLAIFVFPLLIKILPCSFFFR